jgi:hypothetical protein
VADKKALLAGALVFVPLAAVLVTRALSTGASDNPKTAAASMASTRAVDHPGEARAPRIRGRILDADGDAVEGSAVHLVSPALPHALLGETTSDAYGGFSFVLVDAPRVRVVADHDPEGVVTSAELRLSDAETTDVTLVLSPAGVRGTVVDGDAHPVSGVTLSVEGVPWRFPVATSDTVGSFRFGAVPFEATTLVAVAGGFRPARVDLAVAHREDRGELVVRVVLTAAPPVEGEVLDTDGKPVRARVVACEGQPGEARTVSGEDGTFQLPASAIGCDALAQNDDLAPSDATPVIEGRRTVLRLRAGGAIEGTVVDERGTGISSFSVGIESFAGAHAQRARNVGPRNFEDPRGAFRWDKLAPGSYVLTATAPGKPPTRSDAIDVRSGAVTSGVRIVLRRGGTVTGHVFDERHAPIAGADLTFDLVSTTVDANAHAKTDDWGEYRIEAAPAGLFTLRAHKDGFRVRMVPGLRVDSGGTLTQDVTLVGLDGGATFEFGGIGAGLVKRDDGIVIGNLFAGDPAEHAGLREGDRIVSIDGEDTSGLSIADAIQRLRGEAGTSVGVSVMRAGETIDVTIVRGSIVH